MNLDMLLSQDASDSLQFTAAFHTDNLALLHNILCLANASVDSDRYLVFGVTGSANTVCGIEADPNVKDTDAIQTMLRHANLNRIPTVSISTHWDVSGHSVAVLTIANRPDKPFFATVDYQLGVHVLRAGVIYTRVGTTNTLLTSSAPEDQIELMWREHFGLGLPPMLRLSRLLDYPDAWVRPTGDSYFYHKDFSEFAIIEAETLLNGYSESWSEHFFDPFARSYHVEVRYYGAVLRKFVFVSCDAGRYQIPEPKRDSGGYWWLDPSSAEYKIATLMQPVDLLQSSINRARIKLVGQEPVAVA